MQTNYLQSQADANITLWQNGILKGKTDISLHSLTRQLFDQLPGREQEYLLSTSGTHFWAKEFKQGNFTFNFFTNEPPCNVQSA